MGSSQEDYARREAANQRNLTQLYTAGVRRVVDEEAGVIIYLHYKGGITVIPITETTWEGE